MRDDFFSEEQLFEEQRRKAEGPKVSESYSSSIGGKKTPKLEAGEYYSDDNIDGKISNETEITLKKTRNVIDVIKNRALGQYDSVGRYTINAKIAEELHSIKKVYIRTTGANTFAESLDNIAEMGKLEFIVETKVKAGQSLSELFLIERFKQEAGLSETMNFIHVAKFQDTKDLEYEEKMLAYFNIDRKVAAMDEEKRYSIKAQEHIWKRKLFLKNLDGLTEKEVEAAEAELLLARLQALSEIGDDAALETLEEFERLKEAVAKKLGVPKDQLSAYDQNKLLESAMNKMSVEQREELDKVTTEETRKAMEKLAGLDPASKNNRDAKKVDEKGNSINSQQRHLYRNIDGSERLGGFRDAMRQASGMYDEHGNRRQDTKSDVGDRTKREVENCQRAVEKTTKENTIAATTGA
ncbi:MAG: hypothetical protein FWE79_00940, partial [Firmicutes bacterium]|nr:hypothetical protein [Bacillota bacterium]